MLKGGFSMGFPTKVQLIKRQSSEQWYINFPSALAQAMEFSRGETVEWFVEDKSLLVLPRLPPAAPCHARPNARVELAALSGTSYRDWLAHHLRLAVP
jgi:hypothetical protein